MQKKIAIGTRYWNDKPDSDYDTIMAFVNKAIQLTETVIVAINVMEDKNNTAQYLEDLNHPGLIVERVQPWGFTFAMNALVYKSAEMRQKYLLSVSTEVLLNKEVVSTLIEHMDPNTLCVGAAMEGHTFKPVAHQVADGLTIPWNTCRLMNLDYYARFGFPLIGDAAFDKQMAGVEEVAADSLIKFAVESFSDKELDIKLVEIPGIQWETAFDNDPTRREKHEKKLASKIQRPASQMKMLGIPFARVLHIKNVICFMHIQNHQFSLVVFLLLH